MKDLKAIVLAYQQAHNAQDVDQAMQYFTPNVRFEMAGIWVRQGLEEIRAMEEWEKVMDGEIEFGDLKMRNNRLECKATERNSWLKLVGIEVITYDSYRFEFEDDQINRIRAKISPKGEMAIDKAINRVMRWALEAYPDEIDAIIPRGQFNYGKTQAERWLALLKEWQQLGK
ncbi:MAG TPA: hypothetical protein VJ965_06715 [Anaerolineales bacterium]|nr:hypothetical protein [Anaerolineales bacterium]